MSALLPRLGTWVLAFVIGAVYGVAGTIGQAAMWGWFPIGLVVAVIGIAALLVALRLLTGDRWVALAGALGAMLTMMLFSGRGPGGSVVVPAPAEGQLSTGILWTFLVPVVAALVIAWPAMRHAATHTEPESSDTN